MSAVIRIGARASKLSRWQANHVARLLRAHYSGLRVELKTIQTRGDQYPDAPLPAIGGKGVFTAELENALRQGKIDCAVHSLKDLPTEASADIVIAAVPARGDHRDALVSRGQLTLAQLPQGARIGSGSLRRRAQILRLRPDLHVLPIRGNVPTRLRKLMDADSPYDALVLAAAGLQRLRLHDAISEIFEVERMTSAAGQGALGLQCRADRRGFFQPLADQASLLAVTAERAFLAALDVGCALPVGAYARVAGGALQLRGRITSADGTRQVDAILEAALENSEADIDLARQLGRRTAEKSLAEGAAPILRAIQADHADDQEALR